MAEKKPGKARRGRAEVPEALHYLDRIAAGYPEARLLVDLARESVVEDVQRRSRYERKLQRRLTRVYNKREGLKARLVEMLRAVLTGAAALPRPPARPAATPERLQATYRKLRDHNVPELAALLQEKAGHSTIAAFQRFLVDEVVVEGSQVVVEQLLRHGVALADEAAYDSFLTKLRHHVAGSVCHALARKSGFRVTPAEGAHLEAVVERVLRFVGDLLTAEPPGLLVLPAIGTAFDSARHEASPGRPAAGVVKAVLFPGYAVREPAERVVEKALVFTGRPE